MSKKLVCHTLTRRYTRTHTHSYAYRARRSGDERVKDSNEPSLHTPPTTTTNHCMRSCYTFIPKKFVCPSRALRRCDEKEIFNQSQQFPNQFLQMLCEIPSNRKFGKPKVWNNREKSMRAYERTECRRPSSTVQFNFRYYSFPQYRQSTV